MARPKELKTVKDRIENAFLDLMDEKPYPEITITDIINKAEVARVSYYRNYSSIVDIIDSVTDKMAEDFSVELLPVFTCGDKRKMRRFLFNFFYSFQEHFDKICPENTLNREVIMNRLREKLNAVESKAHLDSFPQKYSIVAKLAIIEAIAHRWAGDGFKESPEEMIDYCIHIITSF